MCTLALYFRVFEDYPLVIAANRDEHYDRPSMVPHAWQTSPVIVAGKDLWAGGTWLGVNEHGLTAAILNRRTASGAADSSQSRVEPQTRDAGRQKHLGTKSRSETRDTRPRLDTDYPIRSRGLLCLDMLRSKKAAQGIEFVRSHRERYQPFTLVFADPTEVWAVNNVRQELALEKLPAGLHVFGNTLDFHLKSKKVNRVQGQFAALEDTLRLGGRETFDWARVFLPVLGDHSLGNGSVDPREAICVHAGASGTVSSSIIVYTRAKRQVKTFFCPGPPCRTWFEPAIELDIR